MDTKSDRPGSEIAAYIRKIDSTGVATWVLGFGLVSWLGLRGGGFDVLVFERIGVFAWWIILAGLCLAVLPARRLSKLAWVTVVLLAAFVLWTALSLSWSDSPDKTMTEVARVATYLGVFLLAVFARSSRSARRMTSAVAAAIVLIATVALLSRLHPSWFPEAADTGKVLVEVANRLSYPIGYWNGLGALIAIGLTLLLNSASTARTSVMRSAGTAFLPVLLLTLYFTLSRGSFLACVLALVIYFVLVPDRLPKAMTMLAGAIGGGILIGVASQQSALADGLLNSTARDQGTTLLVVTIVVVLATGAAHFATSRLLTGKPRPDWTQPGRRQTLAFVAGGLATLLLIFVATGLAGKTVDSWNDFKSADGLSDSTSRLTSASGNGRYQYWSSAVDEMESEPLTGTGSGSFEFWWAENGDRPGFIRDAHSLYFQTLGELGIVGLGLLAAFLIAILDGGVRATLRASSRRRPQLAASVAGSTAFCVSAAFDWVWQVPVLPVTLLLLASVLITTENRGTGTGTAGSAYSWPPRIAMAAGSLLAIVAISIPLASATQIEQSQTEFRSGDFQAALESAVKADDAEQSAAAPNLQLALVLERTGDLEAAVAQARQATSDEPVNWRNWLVRSRLEARNGEVEASVRSYRRALRLNHNSAIFE